MYGLLLGLHLVVCLALVAVVLVQSGKGGGLAGGAFGGTAQTVFGGRGATDFITRATMVLAGTFFVTSMVLTIMSSGGARRSRSLIQEQARQASPAVPAPSRGQPGATAPQSGGAAGSGSLLPSQAPAGGAAPASGTAPKPTPAGGTAPAPAGPGNPAPAGGGATKPPGGGP